MTAQALCCTLPVPAMVHLQSSQHSLGAVSWCPLQALRGTVRVCLRQIRSNYLTRSRTLCHAIAVRCGARGRFSILQISFEMCGDPSSCSQALPQQELKRRLAHSCRLAFADSTATRPWLAPAGHIHSVTADRSRPRTLACARGVQAAMLIDTLAPRKSRSRQATIFALFECGLRQHFATRLLSSANMYQLLRRPTAPS